MSIFKPYHRNYRKIKEGFNSGYSGWAYTNDDAYAKTPIHYVRAYKLIQNDLEKLFEYLEPSDEGLSAYSYRIHELLMRTCIEIEANFKAILNENIYTPDKKKSDSQNYNISVYRKIDVTHHLSSYEVIIPIWNGSEKVIKLFLAWKMKKPLDWYKAYNRSKHDRQDAFKKANFDMLIKSMAGLLAVISSQFGTNDFSSGPSALLAEEDAIDGSSYAIGSLFRIRFPTDWIEEEQYDFDWSTLKDKADRFAKIDYDKI
jgi:hypothetical protein